MYHLWFEGSLFTDVGNIWTLQKAYDKNNTEINQGANFDLKRFYNEFAIASGLGIRLNFTIVLIRFDFGIPVHIPSGSALSDRWVIKNIDGNWLENNIFFNFGIGYPF